MSRRKDEDASEQEIENLAQGGNGRGDLISAMFNSHRRDIVSEPLNMDPDPR